MPVKIFDFADYRKFVASTLERMPKRGHGQLRKIAAYLSMHTTAVSQVFRGSKNLTLEQACGLCEYLALGQAESEYFLALVQLERAGTGRLRATLQTQLARMRERANELAARVPHGRKLTDEDKAVFYSNWYYSGVRLASSIPGCDDARSIAAYLGLPETLVSQVLSFLLATGLCVEKDGRIEVAPQSTHLDNASPLIGRHHANWRLKAIESYPAFSTHRDLAYSGLMSVSRADAGRIRSQLLGHVESLVAQAVPSACEELFCLNVDWFGVRVLTQG